MAANLFIYRLPHKSFNTNFSNYLLYFLYIFFFIFALDLFFPVALTACTNFGIFKIFIYIHIVIFRHLCGNIPSKSKCCSNFYELSMQELELLSKEILKTYYLLSALAPVKNLKLCPNMFHVFYVRYCCFMLIMNEHEQFKAGKDLH